MKSLLQLRKSKSINLIFFFSKIGDQLISELEKNNNVNVSYKQYLTNPTDVRF